MLCVVQYCQIRGSNCKPVVREMKEFKMVVLSLFEDLIRPLEEVGRLLWQLCGRLALVQLWSHVFLFILSGWSSEAFLIASLLSSVQLDFKSRIFNDDFWNDCSVIFIRYCGYGGRIPKFPFNEMTQLLNEGDFHMPFCKCHIIFLTGIFHVWVPVRLSFFFIIPEEVDWCQLRFSHTAFFERGC